VQSHARMKTLLVGLVLALAFVATGCVMDEDNAPPIDAPDCVRDCGLGFDTTSSPPSPDAGGECAACGQGMMCVQLLNGTCGSQSVTCVPVVTGCEQALTCSPACDDAYCDRQISTCSAAPCAADIPGAFHCYGV
jgi:hypothetical protein